MALTDEQNTQLEELFKTKLQEQYNRGIKVGILTVSKIVSDKLNDKSVPFAKRIEDVKRFCKIAPSVEQKFNEIAGQTESSKDEDNAISEVEPVENNKVNDEQKTEHSETPND